MSNRSLNHFFIFCLFMLIVLSSCDSIGNWFTNELRLKMMVENAKGLHENSLIYTLQGSKEIRIGKIREIKPEENAVLFLSVEPEYKSLIKEGTLFMINRPLFSVNPPYILADTLQKDKNNPALESGVTVYETSYAKYQLAAANDIVKNVYDKFMQQSEEYLNKLEAYVESDEFDQLLEQLDQMADDLADFTIEQKKRFEKEILPKIEEQIDTALKKYNEKRRGDKNDKLKDEMNNLKKKLDV